MSHTFYISFSTGFYLIISFNIRLKKALCQLRMKYLKNYNVTISLLIDNYMDNYNYIRTYRILPMGAVWIVNCNDIK